MSDFKCFGDPELIQIAARWVEDDEEIASLPKRYGWSMGDLKMTVAGHVLTRNRENGDYVDYMSWYILPFLEWIIQNWTYIFSTDDSKWSNPEMRSAAVGVTRDLEKFLHIEDSTDYDHVSEWWRRHAMRAADSSIPYPDVFFRRVIDKIEISWLVDTNVGDAPADYSVLLPLDTVADTFQKFLKWSIDSAPANTSEDLATVFAVRSSLRDISSSAMNRDDHLT